MTTDNLFKRTGSEDFSKFMKVMVSGPPKSGKTTLLGTVPKILVLDTEPHANNLESIAHKDVPYVTITNSDDLRHVAMILGNDSLRKQLAQSQYGLDDIEAVAIDTLDTLQKLLKAERLKENKTTQFLRDDWGWLKTEMEKIVELFTSLPMHVFFIVHTKTQEIGKGDDAYTTVLPGLDGAIAQSIAGMVGYSLLSFRKEEIAPDGSVYTKYWLRTEGDRTHEFLGTRTAGKLPTIIEPDMATIYRTIMANRPAKPVVPVAAPVAAPAPQAPAAPAVPAQEVDQNPVQAPQVQTPVQTSEAPAAPVAEAPAAPAEAAPAAPAPAAQGELPDNNTPINPAALQHVKKVYDALEIAFPEEIVKGMTMGEARTTVKFWRAVQMDHAEGKNQPGTSAQSEMLEFLTAGGWIPAEGPGEPEPAPAAAAPKVDGTIEEVLAYINEQGDGADLDRVQEAYDLESAKGDKARASLIKKLESFGAKKIEMPVEMPVETPDATPAPDPAPVTPEPEAADTPPTEDEAVKAVEEGLGGVTIEQGINPQALCEVCGNQIDDLDLAELGQKRFSKMLCVSDYIAETKK